MVVIVIRAQAKEPEEDELYDQNYQVETSTTRRHTYDERECFNESWPSSHNSGPNAVNAERKFVENRTLYNEEVPGQIPRYAHEESFFVGRDEPKIYVREMSRANGVRLDSPVSKDSGFFDRIASNGFRKPYLVTHLNDNYPVDPEDAVATTKEEEWVTKKKVELTTTRQIETRVKRQVVLEDGKVVEDSGPMVTTNTTEDTEKQEHSQTEHRTLGDDSGSDRVPIANPVGHIKEIQEKTIKSREETEHRMETENVQHLGDISDEGYMTAVKSGSHDVRQALELSNKKDLIPVAPKIIHQSSKTKKYVDTENKTERNQIQPGGKVINETRTTRLHEEHGDYDLSDDENDSTNSPSFYETTKKENSQKYRQTKEQDFTEYLVNGKKIGEKLHYQAETSEGQKQGDDMDGLDEHSIASRLKLIKIQSRSNKLAIEHDKSDTPENSAKKPLSNFEQEEETRKEETSKWLEYHFGSESTKSSKGSAEDLDDIIPSTQNSFINVTMKSQLLQKPTPKSNYTHSSEDEGLVRNNYATENHPTRSTSPKRSYYKGINHWDERKDELLNLQGSSPNYELSDRPISASPPFESRPKQPPRRRGLNRTPLSHLENEEIRSSPVNRLEKRFQPISPPLIVTNTYQQSPSGKSRQSSPFMHKERDLSDCGECEFDEKIIRETQRVADPRKMESWRSSTPSHEMTTETRQPNKKLYQRTRFAADIPPPPQVRQLPVKQKSKFGESFRKLVGKIRSSSGDRKSKKRLRSGGSRSPSPKENTYQNYNSLDNYGSLMSSEEPVAPPRNRHGHQSQRPVTEGDKCIQRYYLGEDPFSGSIYGREKEYDENFNSNRMYKKNREVIRTEPEEEENYKSRTLGRFSKSTSRLLHSPSPTSSYTQDRGGVQTLPRKLREEKANNNYVYHQNIPNDMLSRVPNYWEYKRKDLDGRKPMSHTRSLINVSFVNQPTVSGRKTVNSSHGEIAWQEGPAKPARTYRSNLSRSQSFNVYPGQQLGLNSYKSQPHLRGVEESPPPLESPSMIYRWSQNSNYVDDEKSSASETRDSRPLFSERVLGNTRDRYSSSHVNGSKIIHSNLKATNSPKMNYSNSFRSTSTYDTSSTFDGLQSNRLRSYSDKSQSPVPRVYTKTYHDGNTIKTISRSENMSNDDYSETVRINSKSHDPMNPSETNTIKIFSKKKIPSRNGQALETIESRETKTVVKRQGHRDSEQARTLYNSSPGGVVIKVRNNN